MYKIGIYGSTGRVGKQIQEFILCDNESVLSYAYSRSGQFNNINELCRLSDVVIDFTTSSALDVLIDAALSFKTPLIIGTTGFTEVQKILLKNASEKIAILYSPNMTTGISIINQFLNSAAKTLKPYDADIIEIHHRNKKDAPSGTALMLGNTIATSRGEEKFQNFHSLRSGNGGFSEHSIIFARGSERITISHQIIDSKIFAESAITAAKWLTKHNKPGLYSFFDIE